MLRTTLGRMTNKSGRQNGVAYSFVFRYNSHQQIREIMIMGYNHRNWSQLVTLVMMWQRYRRSNYNAIYVIAIHPQIWQSPWHLTIGSQFSVPLPSVVSWHKITIKYNLLSTCQGIIIWEGCFKRLPESKIYSLYFNVALTINSHGIPIDKNAVYCWRE